MTVERRSLSNLLVIIGSQVALMIAAGTVAPTHRAYDKAHGSLFLISVLATLVFIGYRGSTTELLRSSWSVVAHPRAAEEASRANVLRVASLLLGLLSVAFVVDLSFLRRGFQIGGAAAVCVYLAVKAFWARWREGKATSHHI